MKKFYYLFMIMVLLIGGKVNAVIMPIDSAQSTTMALTTIQGKQKKLSFFKKLVFNRLIKKINQQTDKKKPLNIFGLIGFLCISFSVLLFIVALDATIIWILIIGILLSLVSLGVNKGKRNIFGILGVIVGGLAILTLYLILRNFGGG